MQRRNVHSGTGARSPPPLVHPVPQHVVRPESFASSPPLTSLESPPPGSPPKPAGRSQQVAGTAGDYQRFSSPPVPLGAAGYGQQSNGFTDSHQPMGGLGGGPSYGYDGRQPQQQLRGGPATNGQQRGPSMQQQTQQQQGWGGPGGQMGGWANDATAQMGMQFGKSAVMAGQDYVERNFTSRLPIHHLQHSFNVSNSYVLAKLRLVLFPWRHRPWSRLVKRSESTGQPEGYKPPREDINSPDLYIPTMALVTYILLSGIVAGSQSRFHPELLGMTASKSLGIVFLEFLVIRLGCYLLDIGGEGTVVDLVSYSGYKFVGIIVTLLAGLLQLRGWMYWLCFIYVFSANGFFLLRSLRYVVLPDPALQARADDQGSRFSNAMAPPGAPAPVSHTQRGRRIRFLFAISASQLVSMWLLSRPA